MKHLKNFESHSKKDTPKFKWKRAAKSTGKWSWLDNNDLRTYYCEVINFPNYQIKDSNIGELINVSSSLFSKDDSKQWQIMFYSNGSNLIFKKRFEFEDLTNAKEFFEKLFTEILLTDKYPDFKKRILDLNRLIPIKNISSELSSENQ